MVIVVFQIRNKLRYSQFFEKFFLISDISISIILEIFFLFFSNANITFADYEPIQKIYTTAKALLTT